MFTSLPKSADGLYRQMLTECFQALKLNTFLDNYDAQRFGFDGIDRSLIFETDYHVSQFKWFTENYSKIFEVMKIFGNEDSKRIYLYVIAYKMAGFHSVRIPVDFNENSIEYNEYMANEKFTSSELEISGMFGKLRHYDFIYDEKRYVVDCLGLKYYLFRKQYFYTNEDVVIAPVEGDYVIDGGACYGDTAIVFGHAVGKTGCVYCFDPIWEHLEVLKYNSMQNPDLNLKLMPYGISNRDLYSQPLKINGYNPGFNIANKDLPLRAIDTLVINGEIEKIDFIKLDVEGAELLALMGATGSIRKFKPKLGISIYHKQNDIIELPLFIKENFPEYKIYLNHYTIHSEETVMYCTV
jgi:FkbM family methyltransferase